MNGNDRKQLSDAIKSGSTANYRLVINQPGEGGTTYGSIVTGLQNEVTGKAVDLMVHPWLTQVWLQFFHGLCQFLTHRYQMFGRTS